jgi:hypothetical protein
VNESRQSDKLVASLKQSCLEQSNNELVIQTVTSIKQPFSKVHSSGPVSNSAN